MGKSDDWKLMQRKFIEAYAGNATEAARIAGYKNPRKSGNRLLTNVDIHKAIQERTINQLDSTIADRKERQQFWTNVFRDENVDMKHRLRASENLGKSEADFTDKTEIGGPGGGPIPISSQVKIYIPDNGRGDSGG